MRANKPTEEKQFESPNDPANEKAAPEAIASGAFFVVRRKPLARRVVRKKTCVDNEEIKTPFAIIGVRSANCTNKQREVIQK